MVDDQKHVKDYKYRINFHKNENTGVVPAAIQESERIEDSAKQNKFAAIPFKPAGDDADPAGILSSFDDR